MSTYKNNRRSESQGSQIETPTVKCTDGRCAVGGYQQYTVTTNNLQVTGGYRGKFNYIKSFLQACTEDCKSVSDLGASNGLVTFTAAQVGYPTVYALDHDLSCIKVMSEIKDELNFETVQPNVWSFGDEHPPTDIVIVGALIHWVYSCTALYGNFDEIIKYLRGLTNQYLLIEWVNPNDPAIKSFNHTSFNESIIKEPYTRDNFLSSVRKYFSQVTKVHSVNSTRELFLCTVSYKNMSQNIGQGTTSIVTYDPSTEIVSKRVTRYLDYSVYEREVYWLRYLTEKNYDWCPKLIDTDPKTKTIRMEYVGTHINKINAPKDWREQLAKILADLAKEGIKHNDIKHTEVLVKDGKIHLIDFGWMTRGDDWSCGQGFSKRVKPWHQFYDHTAMARITKHLN